MRLVSNSWKHVFFCDLCTLVSQVSMTWTWLMTWVQWLGNETWFGNTQTTRICVFSLCVSLFLGVLIFFPTSTSRKRLHGAIWKLAFHWLGHDSLHNSLHKKTITQVKMTQECMVFFFFLQFATHSQLLQPFPARSEQRFKIWPSKTFLETIVILYLCESQPFI